MGARRQLNPLGFFQNYVSENLTFEDGFASLREIKAGGADGTVYELVILEGNATIAISYEQAHPIAADARAFFASLRSGAFAFVAPTNLAYGACRQVALRMACEEVELAVFRTRPEAEAWLLETMARHAAQRR